MLANSGTALTATGDVLVRNHPGHRRHSTYGAFVGVTYAEVQPTAVARRGVRAVRPGGAGAQGQRAHRRSSAVSVDIAVGKGRTTAAATTGGTSRVTAGSARVTGLATNTLDVGAGGYNFSFAGSSGSGIAVSDFVTTSTTSTAP